MAEVAFVNATRIYPGTTTPAVNRLNLQIADGEFVVLVGPSGSGKSTALRMLAGLEDVDDGAVMIGGRDVTDVAPKERDVAMVFQNYALYPHMDVAANMSFALKLQKVAVAERDQRVGVASRALGLTDYLRRKPRQLSGGQRQRVAMGRAMVRQPKVWLMDEPLSNLDAQLRVQTRAEIAELQSRLGITTIFVTHDQVEAMTMGTRVAVLKDGLLQQCDTPRGLYERPVNAFVAAFIGSPSMNLHTVPVDEQGDALLGPLAVPLSAPVREATAAAGLREVQLGVRPESFVILPPGGDAEGVPATVAVVEELGAEAFVYADLELPAGRKRIILRIEGRRCPRVGDHIRLDVRSGEAYAFDPAGGERLGDPTLLPSIAR